MDIISGFQNGQTIAEEQLLLTRKTLRNFNNKPGSFLALTLRDSNKELEGRIWDNAEEIDSNLQEGLLVTISGKVEVYNNALQIIISKIYHPEDAENLEGYLPVAPGFSENIYTFQKTLQHIKDTVASPAEALLEEIFTQEFTSKFLRAPAAIKYHHAYIGGLVEHTLGVIKHAYAFEKYHHEADRTLLRTGALLHDIGKVYELDIQHGSPTYTVDGELMGHIGIGLCILQNAITAVRNQGVEFSRELERAMLHIMASHHGRKDWGALQPPRFLEAILVHYSDNADADIAKIGGGEPGKMHESTAPYQKYYVLDIDWGFGY